MSSPVAPLRLCCLAAMAPALTSEATHRARDKLPAPPSAVPRTSGIPNGRDGNTPPLGRTDLALQGSSLEVASKKIGKGNLVTFTKELLILNPAHLGYLQGGSVVNSRNLINLGTVDNLSKMYKQSQQENLQQVQNDPTSGKPTVSASFTGHSSDQTSAVNGRMNGKTTLENVASTSTSSISKPTTALPFITQVTSQSNIGNVSTANSSQNKWINGISTASRPKLIVQSKSTLNLSTKLLVCKKNVSEHTQSFSSASETKGVQSLDKLINDANKRQKELAARSERYYQRLKRLQSKQSLSHVKQQLGGFVEHEQASLQKFKQSRPQQAPVDIKTELLQNKEVKNLSTAALVNLVQKLQSSQPITLRQHLAGVTLDEEPEPIWKFDEDSAIELDRVSGHLQSNLHHLESGLDSDATESSSGGESCDEMDFDYDWDGKMPRPFLKRRVEWKWCVDRSSIAARWTWLQAQVSDLEYRIRQQNDIYRQIRASKGAVVLGEMPTLDDLTTRCRAQQRPGKKLTALEEKRANIERRTEISPANVSMVLCNIDKQSSKLTQQLGNVYSPSPQNSPSLLMGAPLSSPKTPNGFVDSSISACGHPGKSDSTEGCRTVSRDGFTSLSVDPPSPANDSTCITARCRPLRSYRKRKLLRTSGLHQLSRKAARLSSLRCHCYPPTIPCALCGGRYNHTQRLEPDSMPQAERLAILHPSYHSVLSFNHDVPLSSHFETLLKSGDWKQKSYIKPGKPLPIEKRKGKSAKERDRIRKYSRRLTKSASAAMLSARIKYKYEQKQLSRSHCGTIAKKMGGDKISRLDARLRKRRAALNAIESMKRNNNTAGISPHRLRSMSSSLSTSKASQQTPQQKDSIIAREMREALRKKRYESAYDINNIVIPMSMAASTRVEKLHYKEIITPKWRVVTDPISYSKPRLDERTRNTLDADHTEEDEEDEEVEDLSDETFAARHLRCEINEKKKYMPQIHSQRRGRGNRTDSGTFTPESYSPDRSNSLSESTLTSTLVTPPNTPAASSKVAHGTDDYDDSLRRIGSCPGKLDDGCTRKPSEVKSGRGRSTSSSKLTSMCEEEMMCTRRSTSWCNKTDEVTAGRRQSISKATRSRSGSCGEETKKLKKSVDETKPWTNRIFPLSEGEFDGLLIGATYPDVTMDGIIPNNNCCVNKNLETTPFAYDAGTPSDSTQGATSPSSTSSVIDDDPNDPEWTVVSDKTPTQKQGLVLKLSKR